MEKPLRFRPALLRETICVIDVRMSEVRHIAVEAACLSRAEISPKEKIRLTPWKNSCR